MRPSTEHRFDRRERDLTATYSKTFSAIGGVVLTFQRDGEVRELLYSDVIADDAVKLYREHYGVLNPIMKTAAPNLRLGDVSSSYDFVPPRNYLCSEYFADWVCNYYGSAEDLGVVVEHRPSESVLFMLGHDIRQRRWGTDDKALLKRMSPHLQQAFALRKQFIQCGQAFRTSLDALSDGGVIGLTESGELRFVRGPLPDLLCSSGMLSIGQGRLMFRDAEFDHWFQAVLLGSAQSVGVRRLRMRHLDLELHLEVHHLPNAAGESMAEWAPITIFLRSQLDPQELALAACSHWYRMTETEHAVARLILCGTPTPQIAHTLQHTEATCRTHIKAILRKTGAPSRVGFVALVQRFRQGGAHPSVKLDPQSSEPS